jgi:ubiquinone/menaquinone biosynthesis C-methylase UbiE
VVDGTAEALPTSDGAVDMVVASLVLCTVADPDRALAEVDRVLRPGGRLHFYEHVRAEDPRLASWHRTGCSAPYREAQGPGCVQDEPDEAVLTHDVNLH